MTLHISCLLWNSTRSSRRDIEGWTEGGERRIDREGLDGGRDRDGGSEAGTEGGFETEWTEEGREAGRRKEERVGPSNEAGE